MCTLRLLIGFRFSSGTPLRLPDLRAGTYELSEFCPRTTPNVLHLGTECWP
jgi:hypothetical protein